MNRNNKHYMEKTFFSPPIKILLREVWNIFILIFLFDEDNFYEILLLRRQVDNLEVVLYI